MNIINRMPAYSQAPVKNYMATGQFKDHSPSPIEADDAENMIKEFGALAEGVREGDNGPDDSNKDVGIIESDGFFGRSKVEFEEGQNMNGIEGYGRIGNDEDGATIYFKETPLATDVVVVATEEGMDDGVIHLDKVDNSKSFMTLPEEALGFIA